MRGRFAGFFLLLLVGCGAQSNDTDFAGRGPRPIQPNDFALVGCGLETDAPCATVFAGGKRVQFGAPPGLSQTEPVDAILLFSLAAEDISGLDEIRFATWRAGRDAPLIVAGPPGTVAFAAALDDAFQAADAIEMISAPPPGGFDAALLDGREPAGPGEWVAFDTGDLRIYGHANEFGRAAFRIIYGEAALTLSPCGAADLSDAPSTFVVSCAEDGDLTWPIPPEPQFLRTTPK